MLNKQMLKKFQKMQRSLNKYQEEMANLEVEGNAANGSVKVSLTGNFELKSVKIDKSVVSPDDVEILEDLIMVAYKDAFRKVQEINSKKMNEITGGMQIPGLF